MIETSLVVQWLPLCTANARCVALIPYWGTIPHAAWPKKKKTIKEMSYVN